MSYDDPVMRAAKRAEARGLPLVTYANFYPKHPGFGHGCCWECGGDMWARAAPPLIPPPRRGSKYCSRECAKKKERSANRSPARKARKSEYARKRWLSDPEYRKRIRERGKILEKKPEYKASRNRQRREKRASDPEYRERLNRRVREYHLKPENMARRRLRERKAGNYRRELVALVVRQAGRCAICSKPLPEDAKLIHVDHVISIAAGGLSAPSNLQATCSFCNLSKGGG